MNRQRISISTADLAKICNVSQGTVDRALNNRSDIKAETKQRILEIARQYGYREHIRALPDKIIGQVGIIVFNLENSYFSELIAETEYVLREDGYGTTVMLSHYDQQYEIECIRNLYNMGVNGIILCSVNNGIEFENYLKLFDIPIVAVGNRVASLPYVGIDDFAAMRDITEAVLREGSENVVYFSPALRYPNAFAQRSRYEGFLSAAGSIPYSIVTDIDDIKQIYDKPTTIICSTDCYALRVYFKGTNARIVGFDGIKALQEFRSGITSVGYSMTKIAREAVDIIKGNKKDSVIIPHYISGKID